MKRFVKWLLIALALLGVTGAVVALWVGYYSPTSNPDGYATIGDIPAPKGYHRVGLGEGFARYLRARATRVQGWEKLNVREVDGGHYAIRSIENSEYLCVGGDGQLHTATCDGSCEPECFDFILA